MGDEAYPDASHDKILQGTDVNGHDYQEVLTNFPLASQILTGLFLNITLSGPQGTEETYERTLVDRIGYAVRENGGTPNIVVNPNTPPILTVANIYTIDVDAATQASTPVGPIKRQLLQDQESLTPLQLEPKPRPG